MTAICATCPWRVGATAEPIPNFCSTKARNLRDTVGDGSDAFRVIMACHGSTERDERACGGYLAVAGWTNLAVRLAVVEGRMTIPEAAPGELVGSFEEMLEQLGVDED